MAATLVTVTPVPASAVAEQGCGPDEVAVGVDATTLEAGVSAACVPAGEVATDLYAEAGIELGFHRRLADYVCQVDGLPADADCVGGAAPDAYWSLWWAEPGGEWTYASLGASGLRVPAGGAVLWLWQGDAARVAPSVTPADLGADGEAPTAAEPTGTKETGDALSAATSAGLACALVALLALTAYALARRRRHPPARGRLARELHPLAWWAWAIGLAAAATLTFNPWIHLLLLAAAIVVVAARRTDHPWARVFRLYLALGVVIVVVRVFFRLLVGGAYGETVLLDLPAVPLPDWVHGIQLLGPVTAEALFGGLYDGVRLATLVICVGAANALANPKRMLASLPPALYEVGTALVVAINVMPQLAIATRRVRDAQRLRPSPAAGLGRRRSLSIRRVLVPVLEDALERSLSLAAGMDTRGYGRSGAQSRGHRVLTGALLLAGLIGVGVGVYGVLDLTAPRWLAMPMLGVGVVLAVAGVVLAGRRVGRTRYRPAPWRWPETVVAVSGLAVFVGIRIVVARDPSVAAPDLSAAPLLSVLALVVPLIALAGLAAPPPLAPDRPPRAGREQGSQRAERQEVPA